MSVTLSGSRTIDDRRRRRLAVSGDATGAETERADPATSVSAMRQRLEELPSASPWLPVGRWKQAFVIAGFWTVLVGLTTLAVWPLLLPGLVAPAFEPLLTGATPGLARYVELTLWLLAAEFAALTGWYRSHSQLDFSGRYRIWGWLALAGVFGGFLAATDLHLILADRFAARLTWLHWRRELLAWIVPLTVLGVASGWLAIRDMRRCVSAVWLLRLALLCGLCTAGSCLFAAELECEAWYPAGLRIAHWLSLGLLVTACWRQAWFAAYLCPDPPVKSAAASGGLLRWLGRRWWKPAVEPEPEPAPKRTRRRKVAATTETSEGDSSEEAPAPKRRRKTSTSGTRAKTGTKPRRRAKVAVVEGDGDSSLEDAGTSSWEEAASDDAGGSDSGSSDAWDDNDLEQLEKLTRPETGSDSAAAAEDSSDQDYNSDDGDDSYGRIDQDHGQGDMFKGLSKKQRRELKKQQKETRNR